MKNNYICLYKGPAKYARRTMWGLGSPLIYNKTVQDIANDLEMSMALKSNFNQIETYPLVEYEYNEDAQAIIDSLEDER